MDLWRELLINGLQNENNQFKFLNDKTLIDIVNNESYKILFLIKQIINNEKVSDKECFFKIEKILNTLEENNIYCNRHDFG